jgi:hypothetical protein
MEPLPRLKDAIEQVDKDHPDVRLLSAHVAVVVSAVLSDSENVADENDALTAQNRKLSARVERLERTVGRQRRKLDEALATVAELRTIGNAERRLRRRAEQTRDDAVRASDNQQQPTAVDELVQLHRQLQQAHTDIDRLATAAEDAERERDTALHRRAQLAILLETLGADEPDEVEQPAAPDTSGEVLAYGRHPLVEYSLDQTITDGLDRHAQAPAWRRCVADTIATMTVYATAKADARRTGKPLGPDLADLKTFTRSGHDLLLISPERIALSESPAVARPARFAQQRRFAVPRTVDPAGTTTVLAHIRIGRNPPAPRLYFLDRTDVPDDGKIYLTYLGPHLDNRLTD